MKNILIAIAMLAIPMSGFCQHESIEKFYNKYIEDEKVTDINLNGWVLSLASLIADEKTGEEVLNKITQLRIMIAEEKNIVSNGDLKKLMKDVRKNSFEDLITVRDGNDRINFMIREEGNTITNVLVIVNGDDEFILLSLEGALNLEDLKKLQFDVEGGDVFTKLPRA